MTELDTFNALKYRRVATADTDVSGITVDLGSIYWVNDSGQLHRETGPAVIWADGSQQWSYAG